MTDEPAGTVRTLAAGRLDWVGAASLPLARHLWAAVLAVLLALLKRKSPNVRYVTACIVLAAMSMCPIATTLELQRRAAAASPDEFSTPLSTRSERDHLAAYRPTVLATIGSHPVPYAPSRFFAPASPNLSTPRPEPLPSSPSANSLPAWAFALWLGGVVVLSIRLLGGWILLQRIIGRAALPIGGPPYSALVKLARRMGCRRLPRLLECKGVQVPTMIGGLRSAILLPIGALTGFSSEMLNRFLPMSWRICGGTTTW